jgi:RHS repeat-associated protein
VTWLAISSGSVTAALRYDPWGTPRGSVPSGYSPFRFQGSWSDDVTNLSWVVTRWYAPALGRFLSEDSLLGEPADPPSRHLFAYGAGEPVGRWDPDGRFWYRWRATDDIDTVADRWLGAESRWRAIFNMNLNRSQSYDYSTGDCIWVPRGLWYTEAKSQCIPSSSTRTGIPDENTKKAAKVVLGSERAWYLISRAKLADATQRIVGRVRSPGAFTTFTYNYNRAYGSALARLVSLNFIAMTTRRGPGGMVFACCHPTLPPSGNAATTYGEYVFVRSLRYARPDTTAEWALDAHEYIHVLQWEKDGPLLAVRYAPSITPFGSTGPSNEIEAPGYLWEGYVKKFHKYSSMRSLPWQVWKPL